MGDAASVTEQARVARKAGNLPEARARYREAATLARDGGDTLGYAHSVRHIADILVEEKDMAAARPLYEEALELYRGNLHTKLLDLANTVRPYAFLLEELGETDAAVELLTEARNLYQSLRLEAGVVECERHLRVHAGRGAERRESLPNPAKT